MFSIDLLKGKGRPPKCDFRKASFKMVPFVIPLVAMVAWAASFQKDCAQIKSKQAMIRKNQAVIDDAKQAVRTYQQMNAQLTKVEKCLKTLTKGLSYRIQVTDLLVELVQTLPDEIFLYEMNLERTTSMEKMPQSETKDAEKQLVVNRKLSLTLCGFDAVQSDYRVREYVNSLKTSDKLADIFTDVKPAARRQGVVDRRPATFYEIECILREQK